MYVVIAGGGRTGTQLAALLVEQNHTVRLIEHRREILARMHQELPTESIHEGDATDPAVMEAAGIRQAQVLAACTPDDADNLALCFFARNRFNVPRTIARVNNPAAAWLFNESFGVDVALNQAEVLSSLIEEEMSLGDMMTLLKIRRGRYLLVEEKIPPRAPALGKAIRDLVLPDNCVIATIIRRGEIVVPRGVTVLEEGDEVLAVVDPEGAAELARLFGPGPASL
jgi:trk system potassium uptake protein TrkA